MNCVVHSRSELAKHSDFVHNALMEALNSIELRCTTGDFLDDYLVLRL
jgi:hypothetical protein